MKVSNIIFIIFAALILAACNMTLAQDVTPPPGYVQPTPLPTQGPLYPQEAPNVADGALIYAEKCLPCHGETGLGDGEQGRQLPLPVAALGLPEIAYKASPASWYLTVTLGNIERFMPPFSSLTDQERWDVVAYASTLSMTPEQIEAGSSLYALHCLECHGESPDFATQEKMAAFSPENLDFIMANGIEEKGMPPLGDTLSESDRAAISAYLRTLTFSASSPTPVATAVEPAETPPSTGTEEPTVEETPAEVGETEVPPEATEVTSAIGPVSGMIVNGSGGQSPSRVEITLRGFTHSTDSNSSPQEVVTETTLVASDGSYEFEDIDLTEGRIFIAQMEYDGVTYQSDLAFAEAGTAGLVMPDLTIYETTTETGALLVEQMHISFDFAIEGGVQVFEVFNIRNVGDKTIVVETDGTSVPFLPMPAGVSDVGYELSQESARLLPTTTGFALPPTDESYGIVAFFNMSSEKELVFSQPLALSVGSLVVIVPEGFKLNGDGFIDGGTQAGAGGANFQIYTGQAMNAGDNVEFTVSGTAAGVGGLENRQLILIAAGAMGLTLIVAGVWMFMRDRNLEDDEDDDEDQQDEFDNAEDVMDAIIALDNLYRDGKISEEAHQTRRDELKEILRELA